MSESQHKALFDAHNSLVDAGSKIHETIVALTAAGRHKEHREKFSAVLHGLEQARDHLDATLQTASKARTELIRCTGCDGSCRP